MNKQDDFREPVKGPWDPIGDSVPPLGVHPFQNISEALKPVARYIQYIHHGLIAWVRSDLKGTHRDNCMCYDCVNFNPGVPEENCPIANLLYGVCLAEGIVAPVYECPEFVEGERYHFTTETSQP